MTPTPRVAFITVVATLAYLGLAILGWGSFAAFFSHPPLIALVIVGFVLTGVALFSGGNLSPGERVDRRRRRHSLVWRRSLRRRGSAADLAGIRARAPLQRARRHPARAHAGHAR